MQIIPVLIIIILIVVAVTVFEWLSKAGSAGSRPPSGESFRPNDDGHGDSKKTPSNTFRPSSRTTDVPGILFVAPRTSAAGAVDLTKDIEGLHDAFTGAPLDIRLGLFRCDNCRVYYHAESQSVIVQENAGRCLACGSSSLALVIAGASASSPGRDCRPDVVTLRSFRQFFGHVVTFEGVVTDVKVSRKGSDYAVMFEHKTWAKGLKLVFFRGSLAKVGGAVFVQSLNGRRVQVRGLLRDNARYGPQIIVTQRSMILSVQ